MLGKVTGLKCDEVGPYSYEGIINYLAHVRESWTFFVTPDPSEIADAAQRAAETRRRLANIDQHTVETLQLMAPGASSAESRKVQGLVLSGQVVSAFNEQERSAIWGRLRAVDGLIPSLFTFFEDF
ncbi:hypothetical protein ACJ73_01168 [Blastomyces percursus]|uniref:Uncharacterized protein n=1 Tax=Blastomyces percursus TaxID=1658174 RepID=A0A1J9QG11_9EURO|nr:hypothetical protein ACJ73_01168 [Blastomyces percursus]